MHMQCLNYRLVSMMLTHHQLGPKNIVDISFSVAFESKGLISSHFFSLSVMNHQA